MFVLTVFAHHFQAFSFERIYSRVLSEDMDVRHYSLRCVLRCISNNMKNVLKNLGIDNETTAPYTPQQNGKSERRNQTIGESANTMLLAAKAPRSLWAEAVNIAVHVLNMT